MKKKIRHQVAEVGKFRQFEGTIIDASTGLCSVRIGSNGRVLHGVPFSGGPVVPGQRVYIDWSSGTPVVAAYGQDVVIPDTPKTIQPKPIIQDLGPSQYPIEEIYIRELTVREYDGSPLVSDVRTILVPKDTITSSGSSSVQIDVGNAHRVLGVPVDDTAKGGGKALTYDATSGSITYQAIGTSGAGVMPQWYFEGIVAPASDVGLKFVAPLDYVTLSVIANVRGTGVSGNTVVDVKVNGSTIFPSSQKPTIAYDDVDGMDERVPDITSGSEGDFITVDIVSVAEDAYDLSILVKMESTPSIGSTIFTGLLDTPPSFAGAAYFPPTVNSAETDLVFGNGSFKWDPDAPPASPSSYDDEFNDASLSGWNTSGGVSEPSSGVGLMCHQSGYVWKTLPSGDFTIWTTESLSGKPDWLDWGQGGLFIQVNANQAYTFGYTGNNSNKLYLEIILWNSVWSWNSTPYGVSGIFPTANHQYLRISRTGTTLEFWISSDGLTWGRIYTTTSYNGVNRMGVANVSSGYQRIFSFFRYQNARRDQYYELPGRRVVKWLYA